MADICFNNDVDLSILYYLLIIQGGRKDINGKNDIISFVTFFVTLICMIVIFFTNDFFVQSKKEELAVRLICGATYLQITFFLIFQIFMITLIAIPVAILLTLSLLSVFDQYASAQLGQVINISISGQAILATVIIMGFVIFWSTFLNLGFTYRHTIISLLEEQRSYPKKNLLPKLFNFSLSERSKKIIFLFLFLIPIPLFYINGSTLYNVLFYCIIGMIGFEQSIKRSFIPFLTYYADEKKTDDPDTLVTAGFLRYDLIHLKNNIVLLLVAALALVSIIVARKVTPLESLVILVSYVLISIMQSLVLTFQLFSIIVGRKKDYQILSEIGYTKKTLDKIAFKEVFLLYMFILVTAMLYIANAVCALAIEGKISLSLIPFLLLSLILPIIICLFIVSLFYYHEILK